MANNKTKKSGLSRDQRRMRTQRIIFVIVSVIIILSWILGLVFIQ